MAVTWTPKAAPDAPSAVPQTLKELRAAYDALVAEQDEFAQEIAEFKTEHAVKHIPNNMELARVTLEATVETARIALAEAIAAAPAEETEPVKKGHRKAADAGA